MALEPVLPVHERHAPVHEHERVLARHARHLGGLYEVALGDAAVHGPGPAAPRESLCVSLATVCLPAILLISSLVSFAFPPR